MTTGLLAWLTRQYPGARFTIACGPYGADLFRAVPGLERLIVLRKQKWHGHWFALWRQCLGARWDLIVDLRNTAVSRLLWAKSRAIHTRSGGKHKVVENAAVLGLSPPPDPHIWIAPEAEAEADRILPRDRAILALNPASNWPPKQWPIGHFIEFIRAMTAPDGALADAAVLVIADSHERDQAAPLLASIPDARRIELIGRDLQTVAACLKRARFYVGNDSGVMHLSAALGAPTLGLFGPGYPDIYGPWGKNCAYVTTPESREELLSRLPNLAAREPNLMQSLSVERALAAAKELLARTA